MDKNDVSKDVHGDQQEADVVGTFQIVMYSDGNINVSGPIKNPVVVLDVFGRALTAVADYVTRQAINDSKIIMQDDPKIVTSN